jgi:hypothetical protein
MMLEKVVRYKMHRWSVVNIFNIFDDFNIVLGAFNAFNKKKTHLI